MGSQGKKVCVIAGVGYGVGTSTAKKFSDEGFKVYLLARNLDRLQALAETLPDAEACDVDLTDGEQIRAVVDRILTAEQRIDVFVYNAARGTFGNFLEVDPKELEENLAINTTGLLHAAQAVAPSMIERGEGAILVTGNTSSLRGKEGFSVFAPTKAAQRILAESMARHLGPQGVHVAYLIIDAAIDEPRARRRFPEKSDDEFCHPDGIAHTLFELSRQPRTAWSFQVDLRPFTEVW